MTKRIQRLSAAMAGMLFAVTASADISYSVSIKDSDFTSAAAVAKLHDRIREVSVEVCPRFYVTRDLGDTAECRRDVQADLVERIDHPVLNAYLTGSAELQAALLAERGSREVTLAEALN